MMPPHVGGFSGGFNQSTNLPSSVKEIAGSMNLKTSLNQPKQYDKVTLLESAWKAASAENTSTSIQQQVIQGGYFNFGNGDKDSDGSVWGNIGTGVNGYDWSTNGSPLINPYVPGYFNKQKPVLNFPDPMSREEFENRYLMGLGHLIDKNRAWDDTFHYFWDTAVADLEARLGNFIYPRLCQPKGNSVLTTDGYKDISEVVVGDTILTHNGNFAEVSIVSKRQHVGDMYSIFVSGNTNPIKMTPEHKVWAIKTEPCIRTGAACYSPCREASGKKDGRTKGRGCPAKFYTDYTEEFIEADKLNRGDIVVHHIDNTIIDNDEITKMFLLSVGGKSKAKTQIIDRDDKGRITEQGAVFVDLTPSDVEYIHDKDFWRLVGYYLGDGTLHKHGVSFAFGEHEKEYIEDIQAIASKFNRKASETSYAPNHVIGCKISFKEILPFFKSLRIGDLPGNKGIHYWMERLPLEYQSEMLKGYYNADGNKYKRKFNIVSVSLPLLESMQRIGWRLGLTSSINLLRQAGKSFMKGKEITQQKTYTLVFGLGFGEKVLNEDEIDQRTRGQRKKQWIENGRIFTLIRKIEVEKDIDEPVYNFTVAHEDHSYTGNHIASHNCLTDGLQRGFRPGIDYDLDLREMDFDAREFYSLYISDFL